MNSRFAEHITKEDMRALPLLAFEGKIHVIDTKEECIKAVDELRKFDVLGFDTEKKPTFVKGEYNHTAMVQLSTMEDAYLFRLNNMGYPTSLFDFMADPSILKLGISIDDDLKDLIRARKFKPKNFTDLNDVVRELGVKHMGVKKLAAVFLESRISKNQQVSNWEAETLSPPQQKYAATDAWICLAIHEEMKRKGYI
ncbi:3'-5' exonuclease [Ekhidna lutea]|uniref:3'-5' exonuclease n=1 Tax=Ekhidna lutea TaxID=447679 RepID=A0A239HNM6_EKHLU|nr:3'-5' exonuclease [Ekhidna lutea]SNS82959.1 3'-5' exonuclease [Ekhidna lutea]